MEKEVSLNTDELDMVQNYHERDFLILIRMNLLDTLRVMRGKPIQNATGINELNHLILLIEERLKYIQSK